MTRSRLSDIPYDEWDFEALAEISPGMKPPDLSVVAFFAHHPELAQRFLGWNHYMNSKACELDRQTREMTILRVAVRKRSRYEFTGGRARSQLAVYHLKLLSVAFYSLANRAIVFHHYCLPPVYN